MTTFSNVLILIPVFDDWESFARLLVNLDVALAESGRTARVLAVNDGSTTSPILSQPSPCNALTSIEVLHLRRNLGHQRAIAVGLAYVEANDPCDAVIVMDGDGEDDPRDVPRLLTCCEQKGGRSIVFAERSRRSESTTFQLGYAAYKALHVVLTGLRVRVGNFSAVPRARLASLVVVSEMWNHYAAAVFKSRQPYCTIPTQRAARYQGRSKMSYVSLITHGLSAISVFADLVGVRLLVVTLPLIALTLVCMIITIYLRTMTSLAIPGWATTAFGILAILLFQGVMLAMVFSFMVLGGRSGSSFLPRRDYEHFILRVGPFGEKEPS